MVACEALIFHLASKATGEKHLRHSAHCGEAENKRRHVNGGESSAINIREVSGQISLETIVPRQPSALALSNCLSSEHMIFKHRQVGKNK